ncbi:MAG: hypothetical protein R2771_07645 [Saprospiraceae bacterium]
MSGCVKESDLVQADPNVATKSSFWQNEEDAIEGVNACYARLCVDGTYVDLQCFY